MNRRTHRVQRLVRLKEFHQDCAGATLREAIAEQVHAMSAHDAAIADLDRVGALKPQVLAGGGVDLGRYEVILAMERVAIAVSEAATQRVAEREQQCDVARDGLVQAATATRVARHRGRRVAAAEQVVEEKRAFDRVAELGVRKPGDRK